MIDKMFKCIKIFIKRINPRKFNLVKQYKKLRELILYICDKSKNHPKKLGMVKLNKILFFSDFTAYLRHGSSITGAKYFKNHN